LKDIKTVSKGEMQGAPPMVITEMKKSPNLYKNTVDLSMNGKTMTVQKQIFDGKKGYTEAGGQKKDLTGDDLADVLETADIAYDIHSDKYGTKRTVKGMEKVNGSDAYVLDIVTGKGKKSVEYYDVASGLLVKKVQGEGEKLSTTEFSDYKEIPGAGGYKMPYKIVQNEGGQVISLMVDTAEVNKGIADTEFK
jgi:hypothetical protein